MSDTVQVSSRLVKAKINKPITSKSKQIFYYSIKKWTESNNTEITFTRSEFEQIFNKPFSNSNEIKQILKNLSNVSYEISDDREDYYSFINMFSELIYNKGLFIIDFNKKMVPILETYKQHYLLIGLSILSKFTSGYSITLYEKIKLEWAKNSIYVSREDLFDLFVVKSIKSYNNWGLFKKKVLDVAITEINDYTEYLVTYTEKKEGRKIIGINLYFEKKKSNDNEMVSCHFSDRTRKTESCFKCSKLKKCTMLMDLDLQMDIQYNLLSKARHREYKQKYITMYEKLGEIEQTEIETFVLNQLNKLNEIKNF